jgi:2',3'-cyclic-nucleotide 2'-phosphodiesterase (5'-nucleotidase family)
VVDAGDAFLPSHRVPEPDAERWWATADLIVARYAALGVDALGLGDRDLGLGRARLEKLIAASTFPIVSANLVDKASRKPLAKPFALVERGGVKVAFVGLMSNVKATALAEALVRDGLEVMPASEAWAGVREAVKAAAPDLVVVLSQLDELEERKLGEANPEIRAFLGGDTMMSTGETKRFGDAWSFPGGQKGKQLGVVTVTLGAGFGPAWGQGDQRAVLTKRRDEVAARVRMFEKQVERQKARIASAPPTPTPADPRAPKPLDPATLLQNIEAQLGQARAELQLAEVQLSELPASGPVAGNVFAYRLEQMGASQAHDPDEAKAVGEFRIKWPAPPGH